MPVRVLFGAIEALKSRLLDRWAAGWSVPTDEVFVPARLPLRDVEPGGGIAEPWLRMAARSAAVKWRGEVCGVHRGRVRSVVIAGAGLPQPVSNTVHGAVHVPPATVAGSRMEASAFGTASAIRTAPRFGISSLKFTSTRRRTFPRIRP